MAEKIGVYFDQSSIGPQLDLDELVSAVENKWGGVCPLVKTHPVLASEDGRKMIQADIAESELDAVLICGSSPRVDWDIYDFGPKIMVDRVNLREQCVMSFMEPDGSVPEADEQPEMLAQIAKDYVFMYVAKMKNMSIPQPEIPEITKTIMVIGGGWSGLAAATHVANAGYSVVLVEKKDALGGAAAAMYKTAPLSYPYDQAVPTGIEKKIEAVESNEAIKVYTGSVLNKLEGAPGMYTATITTPSGEVTAPIGAVVLCAGWGAQDTSYLEPLGYGKLPNVVTSKEFEALANEGKLPKKVAFILNTNNCEPEGDIYAKACEEPAEEAETEEEDAKAYHHKDMEGYQHLPMSQGVSSVVALKQAGYVREKNSDGLAFIFYDNMIVQGIHERYYKAAQDNPGVMLTKGDILGITEEAGGLVVKATNTLLGEDIEVKVDMVVVPTGIVPATAKDPIMNFVYRQGPNFPDLELFEGFADSNYICFPYETRRTGVYAAGCIRQPMLMDAAEDDAAGAALKAIQCIESANRGVSVHPRSGDLSYPVFNFVRCTQCKRCTEECPFGALDDDEKGTPMPNPTRCRRCGTCMGACPERVISFDSYGIGMMSEMVKQYSVPDNIDDGGPRILIMACENDAYPALDMAALRGHKWSPYVRIMPVRCLGSVNAIWIKDAMSRGTDGVMLLGCKYGDDYQCHFVKGSEICNRRKENIAETLNQLGIEPERVEQYEIAIDEYDKVPELIKEFMDLVLKLGPNPFKGY